MGAAAAVLMDPAHAPRTSPLQLTASKAWLGHAEPAAGVVGMLHAMHALRRSLALPIAHLSRVNPYVESALCSCSPPACSGGWSLPRGVGGLPSRQGAGCSRLSGVSAFAFQVREQESVC